MSQAMNSRANGRKASVRFAKPPTMFSIATAIADV